MGWTAFRQIWLADLIVKLENALHLKQFRFLEVNNPLSLFLSYDE